MNETGMGGWARWGGQLHDLSFHAWNYITFYHNDHLAWDRKLATESPFVIIAQSSDTLVQHILERSSMDNLNMNETNS